MEQAKNSISNKPLVSVIMPAFNSGNFIRDSIASVLRQTYSNLELIVINDGSTDDTADKVRSISDSRIKLIEQANAGVSPARNNGIKHAKGEFIAFLDSDDLWADSKIEKQVNLLSSKPDIGLVYSDKYDFKENENTYFYPTYSEPLEILDDHHRLLTYNYIPILTVMVRKDLLHSIAPEGFNSNYAEDWDMWITFSQSSRIYRIDECLAFYRIRQGGISKNFSAHHKLNLTLLQERVLSDQTLPLKVKKNALFILERNHLAYLLKSKKYFKVFQKILSLIKKFGFWYTIKRLWARLLHTPPPPRITGLIPDSTW